MSDYEEHIVDNDMARDGIEISSIPEVNPTNDELMRGRRWGLYGNTKMTDAQIVYFMLKHNGDMATAAIELKVSRKAIRDRVKKIPQAKELSKNRGAKNGRPRGLTPLVGKKEEVIKDIKDGMNNVSIARKYGVNKSAVTYFKYRHGTTRPVQLCNKFTDEELIEAYRLYKGNKAKIAKHLKCAWTTIDLHCRRLGL
jgi:transposase-like protein